MTWTFAIPVGIYSAVRQHSVGDYLFTLAGFTGLAVPDFLLGLVLMYLAFAYLNQSVGGLNSADFKDAPWDFAQDVGLRSAPLGARRRARHVRHGEPDSYNAEQPAR